MRARSTHRGGYTLLEVLIAFGITMLILAGLYAALETQMRQMDEGRSRVERSTLARAIFNRISLDTSSSLTPVQPASSTSSSSSMADLESEGASFVTGPPPMHIGVRGDSQQVTVYHTRLNRSVITPPDDGNGNINPFSSDVVRISYFLSSEGGLARQEIRMVTSDLVDDVPMTADEYTRIIAREVESFEVRYFDGSSWQSSWEGSEPGPDGMTPKGPPRAIEVTLGLRLPGFEDLRTYRHVIAFPAAPGDPIEESQPLTPTTESTGP